MRHDRFSVELGSHVCAKDGYEVGTVSDRKERYFVVNGTVSTYHIPYGAIRDVSRTIILSCKLEGAENYKQS